MKSEKNNKDELLLREKWLDKAMEDGKPKKRHVYGQFRKEELRKGVCAVYVADKALVDLAGALSESLSKEEQIEKVRIVAIGKPLRKSLRSAGLKLSPMEETLAGSETVIALGNLPIYFSKRDGQKVLFVSTADDDSMPREVFAVRRAASLLNSSESIRVGSDTQESVKAILGTLHSDEPAEKSDDKKHMLIISDNSFCDDIEGIREIFNLASFITDEKYQLTVLISSAVEDSNSIYALRALPDNMDLVIKRGPLACSVDDYVYTHLLIDRALPLDDTVRDVFRTEAVRLTGRTDFDSIICFGEICTYVYYLVESMTARKKMVIEPTIPEEQTPKGILNRIEHEAVNDWSDITHPQMIPIPYCYSDAALEDVELKEAEIEGNRYCAIETPGTPKLSTLQLLLSPEEGKDTLIAYGESETAGKAIESFATGEYADKKLFLYGGDPSALRGFAEDFDVADRIEIVAPADVQSYGALKSYLKRFDAYLTADTEEYNEIGDIMHHLGKPVISADTGKPADIDWDANREDLRDRLFKELF